uniref:Odorant receptor n=1 Tax=Protaetia brevitarsis TaxID=348688 RepID=A0A411HR07_PROBE|nr:odorant receptor [Protaetia brevitarsis]
MSFWMKLHSLLVRCQILKDCAHFLGDSSKYVIVLSKLSLIVGNLWLKSFTKTRRIVFYIMITLSIVHHISILLYCGSYVRDVDSLSEVLPTLSLGLQVMNKISIIAGKSNQLDDLVKLILHDFWPSNVLGPKTDRRIAKATRRILTPIVLQSTFGVCYSICCVFLPIFKTQNLLLHQAWYPKGLDEHLIQKALQIMKSYTMNYLDCLTVTSFDLLYVAMCVNCSAQFRLLCGAIETLGTGKDRAMIWRITNKPTGGNEKEVARELLVICLEHHQKLIKVADEMNAIFGRGHFVQFCATLIAICSSFYNIVVQRSYTTIAFSLGYYLAHFWQFFVYCSASNYLSDWSTCVSDSAYNSNWYSKDSNNIRKCLTIMMLRSQKRLSMNAFGLFELNYVSFLMVMRFSFSLYTFLRTVAT